MAKSSSLLPRGFKAEAERIAEKQREEAGLSKFSPLNAFDLAKQLGIPVCPVTEILTELQAEKIIHPIDKSQEFSALWMPNCDGDPIIIYNPCHSAYRQQSDLMHEIAHILRKHETPDEIKKLCLLLNLRSYDKLQEAEAKYLGGCLQITRAGLLWALKNNYSYEQISEYYCASADMVRYRINSTVVERQRAHLYGRKK
jgi:Zn-dependent peptidase ImmA (M78 family)